MYENGVRNLDKLSRVFYFMFCHTWKSILVPTIRRNLSFMCRMMGDLVWCIVCGRWTVWRWSCIYCWWFPLFRQCGVSASYSPSSSDHLSRSYLPVASLRWCWRSPCRSWHVWRQIIQACAWYFFCGNVERRKELDCLNVEMYHKSVKWCGNVWECAGENITRSSAIRIPCEF